MAESIRVNERNDSDEADGTKLKISSRKMDATVTQSHISNSNNTLGMNNISFLKKLFSNNFFWKKRLRALIFCFEFQFQFHLHIFSF